MNTSLLLLILPIVLLQLLLLIFAIVSITKRKEFKYFNKPIWLIIAVFINLLGPILYFALEGRE